MKMIFESGASPTPPTPPSPGSVGYPTNGALGVAAPTVPGAYAWYQMMQEIVGVIAAAGLTPSETDLTQLQQALDTRYQVPTGSVVATASSSPAVGWLLCDGSSVSRADHPALFAAIGTTFGSSDGSTFNLPDLRGEFIRGLDNGRGVDAGRTLGSHQDYATAAPKNTSPERLLQDSTTPTLTNATNPSAIGFARVSKTGEGVTDKYFDAGVSGYEMDGMNVMVGDAETRPRNVALNYIIRT